MRLVSYGFMLNLSQAGSQKKGRATIYHIYLGKFHPGLAPKHPKTVRVKETRVRTLNPQNHHCSSSLAKLRLLLHEPSPLLAPPDIPVWHALQDRLTSAPWGPKKKDEATRPTSTSPVTELQ